MWQLWTNILNATKVTKSSQQEVPYVNVQTDPIEIISTNKVKNKNKYDKTFLIHRKCYNNEYEFYDGEKQWIGTFNDLERGIYLFIPVERNETLKEGLERIEIESKEIYEKSNGEIDMRKLDILRILHWSF